jgi:putative chitinase
LNADLLAAATSCGHVTASVWADAITAAMAEFDIDSRYRQAAFLAQVGHESGGFRYTREIWGPTPDQARYEGRADLGNTVRGDGFVYRGRGLIQITGRSNYAATAAALSLPLLAHPELLEQAGPAARSAAWFWQEHGLNPLADQQLFTEITRRINGGQNGAPDRLRRYELALGVLA